MLANTRTMRSLATAMALLVSLAGTPAATAQFTDVPNTISYQGYLGDKTTGLPFNGSIDMTFRLYDVDTGGTEFWTETHAGVPVANGVFTVQLGSITRFRDETATSDYVLFDRPYFMSIQIAGDPVEMSPRIPLSSTPYAFAGPQFVESTVDCTDANPANHESLQEALDAMAIGRLAIINVDGYCKQNLYVRRDNVLIRGVNLDNGGVPLDPPQHGIIGQVAEDGAVTVIGATSVTVDNLELRSDIADGDAAVVTDNGAVIVRRTILAGARYGALATRGGLLRVEECDVNGNSGGGVILLDGAHGRIEDCDVQHADAGTPAVSLYRADFLRLRGINTIENTAGGLALDALHHVNVRQDGGQTLFIGDVAAGNNSVVELRDPQVDGALSASGGSRMRISPTTLGGDTLTSLAGEDIDASGGSSVQLDGGVTGKAGNIRVTGRSALSLGGGTSIDAAGNLEMWQGGAVDVNGTLSIGQQVRGNAGASLNVNNGATLDVGLDMDVGHQASINVGDGAQLTVNGVWNVFNLEAIFVGNGATVDADANMGAISVMNLFGDGITYVGDINTGGDPNQLGFGTNATIDGVVDCGGGSVNVGNEPTFTSPGPGTGEFVNCNVFSGQIDLGVSTVDDVDPVAGSGTVTYTSTISNLEAYAGANNVVANVTMTGTSNRTITSATSSGGGGSCTFDNSGADPTATCDLGFISGAGTGQVIIEVSTSHSGGGFPPGPETLTHTISVSGDETDSNPANDSDAEMTTVNEGV